ncbi:unnamed protein product [Owenia fusiformis]|uniref:Uncharacterized protein n=1 Tax=Owenia fusiformis TaxID=6347 RepID=A0A8J1T693_OWEFU|nr:unnamed protein product [Owenia fusiformis]
MVLPLDCIHITEAFIARLLFATHGCVAVWRVAVEYGEYAFVFLSGAVGIIIEGGYVIKQRRGIEISKRFCPTVLFYLIIMIPCVWLLEMERLNLRQPFLMGIFHDPRYNATADTLASIDVPLSSEHFRLALEQSLLLLMILGRWLLPKGEMSRQQVSQLLLNYLGMAADIVDLFELFREEGINRAEEFVYSILTVYSLSLCQFTFALPIITDDSNNGNRPNQLLGMRKYVTPEVASVLVTLFIHDGPFLCVRLVAIFYYNVYTYSVVFFTTKNGLMVILQSYRLFGICLQRNDGIDINNVEEGTFQATDKQFEAITDERIALKTRSNIYQGINEEDL